MACHAGGLRAQINAAGQSRYSPPEPAATAMNPSMSTKVRAARSAMADDEQSYRRGRHNERSDSLVCIDNQVCVPGPALPERQ
jgi:hypothetical protein